MPTVNSELIAQLERRQSEIKREATAFIGELERRGLRADQRLDDVSQARFDRYRAESRACAERIKELREEDARRGDDNPTLQRIKGTTKRAHRANAVAPLGFDTEQLKAAHQALERGESRNLTARAFITAEPHLPASLFESVIGPQHESRLLDRLPTYKLDGPSLEYVRHTASSGAPAIVGEGQLKPEITMTIDHVIATAQKIAAHTAVSWEIISDWSVFDAYVKTELTSQVIDVETNELLNGDGTAGHLDGILNVSGILTHALGTDTPLDALELAITALRTGPALAVADLLVLHPATWSAVRRSKDAYERYLVAPDPTADEANSAWGVPVLTTTQIAPGVGCLLDTRKFGRALVREPLLLRLGFANDDFTRNLVRTICEERLTIAVERPGAVCKITGLPTA